MEPNSEKKDHLDDVREKEKTGIHQPGKTYA